MLGRERGEPSFGFPVHALSVVPHRAAVATSAIRDRSLEPGALISLRLGGILT